MKAAAIIVPKFNSCCIQSLSGFGYAQPGCTVMVSDLCEKKYVGHATFR